MTQWSSGDSLSPSNLNTRRPSWSSTYPVYDVQEFGALGDGSTDDSSAITTAVSAVSNAGGGILWFPSATSDYLYDGGGSVPVDAPNITITGDPGTRIRIGPNAEMNGSSLFLVSANSFRMKDLVVDGSDSARTQDNHVEFINNTHGHRIEDCTFIGADVYAIRCQAVANTIRDTWIDNCQFSDCSYGVNVVQSASSFVKVTDCKFSGTTYGGVGISFDRSPTNIQISGCETTSGDVGIGIASCQDVVVSDCITRQTYAGTIASGIHVETTSGQTQLRNVLISNCRSSENSNYGISMFDADDVTVTGCSCESNGAAGVYVEDSQRVSVLGTSSSGNSDHGINVYRNNRDIYNIQVIGGRYFNNSSDGEIGTNSGVLVGSGVTSFVILGVEAFDSSGSATQRFGIRIGSSDVSSVVQDNLAYGNLTSDYFSVLSQHFAMRQPSTWTPASGTAAGEAGTLTWGLDSGGTWVYLATSAGSWSRAALNPF